MTDQTKENQQSKIKELFEKENFRKNNLLTSFIQNPATNAIPSAILLREKQINDLGIDIKTLDEILKRDELKNTIIYNPQDTTVSPTWKKLRNILYLTNIDKDIKTEVSKQIEDDVKAKTKDYKIEHQSQNETIKITVTSTGQEENLTKVLFDDLFMKNYKVGDKSVQLICAIEEEQFAATPAPQFYPQHSGFKSNNPTYPMFDQRFQQNYMNQILQQQIMMKHLEQMNNLRGKGNRIAKNPQQGGQFQNKNGVHFNNQAKPTGNGLHQPVAQHNQNKGMKPQNKAGKFNKHPTKGFKSSQKVFNPSEQDFPTLQ